MIFSTLAYIVSNVLAYSPPGLILSFLSAFVVDGRYFKAYKQEFVGTFLMIAFTFSAGKWVGVDTWQVAWLAHAVGVIAADRIGGGPHVNPAVSVSMWSLGKCTYTEMYVRIAGQMGGGLLAFPLYRFFSNTLGWNSLGGPEFSLLDDDVDDGSDAAFSEFFATILLCFLIYLVNWELNFGKYHYWIKQTLTAFGIRYLIEVFPTAGPAMNPMLGTTWAVFNSAFDSGADLDSEIWENMGTFPQDAEHYFVYWISPICGALTASFLYAIYSGDAFFGHKLPMGPLVTPIGGVATPSAPSK
uniref:Aquaporin n=1 Tax=Eucampia antarctica TaxID=49252 RepID=A0A7S2SJE7_9STRA|mmetsp:Transcript_9169/g.8769  ORF Transcript_9169/g.8769 Transcript_9169/m.8769 type:complete len:300 (+) Transcript_9169:110-1009(+)